MRIIYTSIFLFVFCSFSNAQKNDYLWPLGLGPKYSDFRFFFNFHTDPPSIRLRTDTMSTGVFGGVYSNDQGELVAYTNGLWILNKSGNLIENAFGLNPTLTQGQTQGSYGGRQSGFFLGHPSDSNRLYFIHLDVDFHPDSVWPYRFVGRHLMVTTLDMAANNGAGKAIAKNEKLLTGLLMTPHAVRHANGRDWWVFVSDADENRHYRFLLTPEGFSGPDTQYIGTKPNPVGKNNSGAGNAFSPNGRYYIDHNSFIGFSVFEFDRCSGLLSNERRVEWPQSSIPGYLRPAPGFGNVFSPDEKRLYVTASYYVPPHPAWPASVAPYLFQFDLEATDLAASIDTLNSIDTLRYFPYGLSVDVMWGAEMGPDGRIYIVHNGNSYCTVHYPNVLGKGCKFVYNMPAFNNIIGESIPVFPNYRLGPLDGSPCDTLGLNNIPVAYFRVEDTLDTWTRFFYDLSYREPAQWAWDFGDGAASPDTSPVHAYAQPGKYRVCLTVSNANGSDTYCRDIFVGLTGEKEVAARREEMRVYPNPAREVFYAVLPGAAGESVSLSVTDMLGQTVWRPGRAAPGMPLAVPILGWKPGLYIVVAEWPDGRRRTRKVVVEP